MLRAEAVVAALLALCVAGASAGAFLDGWWEFDEDAPADDVPQNAKAAAAGVKASGGPGPENLCMGELEQWKLCLVGTPIQTLIPDTLKKCKFGKPLYALEQKCPSFKFLKKAFEDLVAAGECAMADLGMDTPAGIAYISGTLPATMALSITAEKHEACMTSETALFEKAISKCSYSTKIQGMLKKGFTNVADVKCFLDLAYDACDVRARKLMEALMKGMNLLSG